MFLLACAQATTHENGQHGTTAGQTTTTASTGTNGSASNGTNGDASNGTNGGASNGTNGSLTNGASGGSNGGATNGTNGGNNGGNTGGTNGGTTDPSCDPSLPDLKGCSCPTQGETRPCYTGPAGTENVGTCKDGQQTCVAFAEFFVWSACSGDVTPANEICSDTNDENCNGKTGCADSACVGIAGCCAPGTSRNCYDGPNGTDGVGVCHGGTQSCDSTGAWMACTGEVLPSTEMGHCADGADNDCNGLTDCNDAACTNDPVCAPPVCTPGAMMGCYDGPAGTENVGVCHGGNLTCNPDGKAWGTTCAGEVLPGSEAGHCSDGIDNDCSGLKDCADPACNGDPACACTPNSTRACYTGPAGTAGVGICHNGTQTCNSVGSAWGPCLNQQLPSVEAGACNDGLDNDCNGKTDCADSACTLATNCCVPVTTYDNTLYATSGSSLYKIDPTTWGETAIGSYGAGVTMIDVAMTPDGNVYTVSSTALYHINLTTGAATKVMDVPGTQNNALTFLPDNRLLGADASGQLKVIDPVAGTVTNIGKYGNSLTSAGDLVAVGDGTMFGLSATAVGGADISSNNLLITVNTSTGVATPVGQTGFGNVFGIAYYRSRVIAFTGAGQIIEINPTTGAGTLLATHSSHPYYGGTVSPLIPINGCM
jgi:hypothetical protein